MSTINLWVRKSINGTQQGNYVRVCIQENKSIAELLKEAMPLLTKKAPADASVTINKMELNINSVISSNPELRNDARVIISWEENGETEAPSLTYPSKVKDVELKDMSHMENIPEDINKWIKAVTIIIQVCTEYELYACINNMRAVTKCIFTDLKAFYLGMFAECCCALVVTETGKRCKIEIEKIVNSKYCSNAKLIIGIGNATGLAQSKLGDVLVATQIVHYDEGDVKDGGFSRCGNIIDVSDQCKTAFVLPDCSPWKFECTKRSRFSKHIPGLIASCPFLVDSKPCVDSILKLNKEVKGVEMEGYILQNITIDGRRLDVIIIKGVVRDESLTAPSDDWKYTAAYAAADFAKQRLRNFTAYKCRDVDLEQGIPMLRPTMEKLLHFGVVREVGSEYKTLGIILLKDSTGAVVNALENEHSKNADNINTAIFRQWLQGKGAQPVTWFTLIDALRKIRLQELADDVECRL